MNIKILESHYLNSQTNELLQQYLTKHHLPNKGFYHVVAIRDQTILALGMLYTNKTHPYRDYILFHKEQEYLDVNLFSSLIKFLEKNSKTHKLQMLVNSRDSHIYDLLESHDFYIARTTYWIELNKLNELVADTTIKTKSLNQMSVDQWIEFKKLFHFNYSRYHESVNRLAHEISPDQLFGNLGNINLVQSRILLNSNYDPCSYILIGNSDDNLIEIAYIGGMFEEHLNDYFVFFHHELITLIKEYKTIYFEADDSDFYISALVQKYNCDVTNSFYTFIKDIEQ